jgi:ribonuclease HI
MSIIIFTDGSCTNNGQYNAKGGYGIHFPNNEFKDISQEFLIQPITNQRTELYGILQAIKIVVENNKYKNIKIYTDSIYSIKCLTKWINQWSKDNWMTKNKKPVKNLDIILPIQELMNKYNISFNHIRSHTGKKDFFSICNEKADKLAKSCYTKPVNKTSGGEIKLDLFGDKEYIIETPNKTSGNEIKIDLNIF